MAYPGSQPNAEFGAGINHPVNPGRQNLGSVTLGGSLQADSARWDATTPHAVLHTAQSTGTPADTAAGIEFGQQSVGNLDDTAMAGQSWDRALMQRAADIGIADNIA